MTRIMFLDVASNTGHALYDDVETTPSGIHNGVVRFEGKTPFDKVKEVRRLLPPIIRRYDPDVVYLEAPLLFFQSFKKKPKKDMLTGIVVDPGEQRTMNPATTIMLNRISGAVQCVVEGFRLPCYEVQPKVWMQIIPKAIKGDTKQRVRAYADMLGIVASNQDAFDASVGAVWASGNEQERAMLAKATGK